MPHSTHTRTRWTGSLDFAPNNFLIKDTGNLPRNQGFGTDTHRAPITFRYVRRREEVLGWEPLEAAATGTAAGAASASTASEGSLASRSAGRRSPLPARDRALPTYRVSVFSFPRAEAPRPLRPSGVSRPRERNASAACVTASPSGRPIWAGRTGWSSGPPSSRWSGGTCRSRPHRRRSSPRPGTHTGACRSTRLAAPSAGGRRTRCDSPASSARGRRSRTRSGQSAAASP